MNYKKLESIRQIFLFPFRLIRYPFKITIWLLTSIIFGFFLTDWNDEWYRNYYKKEIKDCFKF